MVLAVALKGHPDSGTSLAESDPQLIFFTHIITVIFDTSFCAKILRHTRCFSSAHSPSLQRVFIIIAPIFRLLRLTVFISPSSAWWGIYFSGWPWVPPYVHGRVRQREDLCKRFCFPALTPHPCVWSFRMTTLAFEGLCYQILEKKNPYRNNNSCTIRHFGKKFFIIFLEMICCKQKRHFRRS